MMPEPILFLPPEGADTRFWGPVMAAIGTERMVMAAPVHKGERIEEIASELVTSTPQRIALCGAGLGGMVAMEIARRAPERITRMALMDTSPHADMPDEAAERETRIIKARTGKMLEVFEADARRAGLAEIPDQVELLALALDMADHLGAEAYIRQLRCLMRRRDQQTTLRRLSCPALVLCGAGNQRYNAKRHIAMAELIPEARLEIVEGAGHLTALERPVEVVAALRAWLA